MSVYVIAIYDIKDQESYNKYLRGVGEVVEKHNGDLLVADFDARRLEGEKRDVYVVLRFESEDAAMGWYDDPAYKPLRDIRLSATENVSTVLAKQVEQPG